MRNAPRVRVGSATACPAWISGDEANSDAASSSPSEARLIGVFAGHIVTYERSPARILVRQTTTMNTSAMSGNVDPEAIMNLPEKVKFASHHDEHARFALMWSRVGVVREGDEEAEDETAQRQATVYVADVESKSFTSIPFREFSDADRTTESHNCYGHLDGAVDSSGENVALVDATRGRLWHWSASKSVLKSHQQETGEWEQRLLESASCDTDEDKVRRPRPLVSCATGRFVSSSLLGRCFMLVRVSWDSGEAVLVEKWLFDIERDWTTIKCSSAKIPIDFLIGVDSSATSPETMQLRMNNKWTHGALAIESTLMELAIAWELLPTACTRAKSCIALKQKIVDLAWIGEDDVLALLLADGQIIFASSSASGSFDLHEIETQGTTPQQLCLSSLVGRAIRPASRLLWLKEEAKMLVQTASGGIIFSIELVRDGTQSKSAEKLTVPRQPVHTEFRNESSLRRRRRRRACSGTRVDDDLRSQLDRSASPSAVMLLEIARVALYESTVKFQDVFFTLVSIIYQQLEGAVYMTPAESAHIGEESVDQKLLEAILSLIISEESKLLLRIASRILSAPAAFTSRAERRLHYCIETNELSRVSRMLVAESIDEDQISTTPSRTAFFDIYLPKISSLLEILQGNVGSMEEQSGDTMISFEYWQKTLDAQPEAVLREAQRALSKKTQTGPMANSANVRDQRLAIQDSLLLVFVSYAMACSFLRIDSVHVDLQHVLSVAQLRRHTSMKREQLACFATPWSQSTDTMIPAWSLATVFEFARATQTIGILVDFCTASKSLFAHECLKEISTLQAKFFLNSKNILFEKKVEVTRHFESLHLQVCESYIGEMVGMLREIPLVLQFKHSIKDSDAIDSGAFSSSKDVVTQRFEVFTRRILTEMDDVAEDLPVFRKYWRDKRFWKHSSREACVRLRCFRLKSRILWHLKQLVTCDEQSLAQKFERIFLIDFLSGRCGNTEEAKLIAKFIDKAQDAVSCDQWQQKRLSFDNYQQLFNKRRDSQSHYRVDKIVRTLALLVWAIWIRERCAYCLRSIELLKGHEVLYNGERSVGDTERKRLGSLAATCALQLNVLGILVGKPDDIFALQISLLEEAAKMNPEKAVAVICWAFPAGKIQARYLKRYKSLRQALKADSGLPTGAPPIEETEHHCQFIQRHVKKSIHWSITSGSIKPGSAYLKSPKKHEVSRSWTAEIDVLVDCCCDLEFQKTTWALIQKKFASASRTIQQNHGETKDPNTCESNTQLKKMLVQSRSSTADGVISRKEVMLLLQEQKRELEGKVRSWSTTSLQETNVKKAADTTPPHPASSQEEKTSTVQGAPTDTKNIKKSFAIRDIAFESGSDEMRSPNRKRKQAHQTERRESVQNVIKLLSLRKQRGNLADHRSDSLPNMLSCPGVQQVYTQPQRGAASGSKPNGAENAPSPKRHARESSNRVASYAPPTENQQQNGVEASREHLVSSDTTPLVFPLRYETGVDSNSYMKLLGRRTSGARAISLKAKQFSLQQQRLSIPSHDDQVQAWNGVVRRSPLVEENVVNLKTAGAQTDGALEKVVPVVAEDAKRSCSQSTVIASMANDAATQAEAGEDRSLEKETQEAAIQCIFKDKEMTNFEDATSFETEGFFNKFPVFIELDPSKETRDMPKKFIQVTRFGDHFTSHQDEGDNEKIMRVSEGMDRLVVASHTEMNQSNPGIDGGRQHPQASAGISGSSMLHRGKNHTELRADHQMRYRTHFSTGDSSGKAEVLSRKSSMSNGRSSLIGLKEDMERLKRRLAQLEHCADEIDEDFKDSHHKLDRIEKEHDSHELATHTRLLGTIDDTLGEMNGGDLDPRLTTSVLSKKASKDIGAARQVVVAFTTFIHSFGPQKMIDADDFYCIWNVVCLEKQN